MSKNKRSITRDNVFRNTGSTAESPRQGVSPAEPVTRQTAVWLAEDDIDWLDDRLKDMRRSGWRTVTRSALIRALIRAAIERDPDLKGVSGEQELVQRVAEER